MGCISSKAITRSMSITEELKHGFKSRSLVYSGETYLHQINASTTHDPDPDPDPDPSTPNASNIINAETALLGHPDSCKVTLRENEMVSENRWLDLEDKNVGGSRSLSFHTVEEYDALLERIRGTRSLESLEVHEEAMPRDSGEEDSGSTGWKRKAIRKGLKTLHVSSPPDFPATSRFKQTTLVQGPYVTPKFGSYNDPATTTKQKEENAIFSSELLAAFEDCMQQLQLEEDAILRHMDI